MFHLNFARSATKFSFGIRSGIFEFLWGSWRQWPWAAAAVALALLCGCQSLPYLAQAAIGQADLLARRRPVAAVLADPGTPADLKARLARVEAIRTFAGTRLSLPTEGQYTTYADLERPYAVWVVFAGLRGAYRSLKASWGGYAGYDVWMAGPPNNAQLGSLSTYHRLRPGFTALIARSRNDLPRFYAACRRLADLPMGERHARLQTLADEAASAAP